MPNPDPTKPAERRPAQQTDEAHGKIKRPQQTDATMAEKDLPRGSEKETHSRK